MPRANDKTAPRAEERRRETRDAAVVLVDDLDHIRQIISKPEPTPGDIRRTSALLRRILIDGDLGRIAAPRVGRILLTAPDTNPVVRASRKYPFDFFVSANAQLFGIEIAGLMGQAGRRPSPLDGYNPGERVEVRLDGFNHQRVIYFQNTWITRADVIKYVANVAHGVHSGRPREEAHRLLQLARKAAHIEITSGAVSVSFNPRRALFGEDPEFKADPKAIDCVLLELLAAATFLTESNSVLALEASIKAEA